MAIDPIGLTVFVVFYLLVLLVGVGAARWFRKKHPDVENSELALVAGRKLGGFVGIFTMTATIVGGGFINGTAESVAKDGLVWTLAPFGIFLGLIIGGLAYAGPMRRKSYTTMFDPIQHRYGNIMVVLLYLATTAADIFWSASILIALGTSLNVIIGLAVMPSILMSAGVAVVYVMCGQMVAVAYTDVIQLTFIIFGLVLCLPFVMTNDLVGPLVEPDQTASWLGQLDSEFIPLWVDLAIAMTFGTIPWQSYFQRVLSVKSARQAQLLSVAGAFGALLLAVPPFIIGAVATTTNWTGTSLGESPIANDSAMVLPLVLYHLTPPAVSIIGLGAIAAATMSSLDSAVLGSASLFTHNIYRAIFRSKASDGEVVWVHRAAVLVVGVIATVLALFVPTIYGLFILAADLVFVIMLPQLTAVLLVERTNTYGAILGYILGIILRFGAGEGVIQLEPWFHYPLYSEEAGQLFPYRTLAMIASLLTIIIISLLIELIFLKNIVPRKLDFLNCYPERPSPGPSDESYVLVKGSPTRKTWTDDQKDSPAVNSLTGLEGPERTHNLPEQNGKPDLNGVVNGDAGPPHVEITRL